jgi:hypothetical protein
MIEKQLVIILIPQTEIKNVDHFEGSSEISGIFRGALDKKY